MPDTKTYDAGKVIITWGPHIVTGTAEGSFVRASRNKPSFAMRTGSDGASVRSKSRDKSGTVEIVVMQTSPSNDFFAAMAVQDELFDTGIMPLVVKDLNGTTLITGAEAWLQKPADVDFGSESGDRSWTFDVGQLVIFPGGAASL